MLRLAALLILLSMSTTQTLGQSIEYPTARRTNHTDEYHGQSVEDPYRWMEKMAADETLSWVRAQDKLTDQYLDSQLRESIEARLSAMHQIDIVGMPIRAGEWTFIPRTPAGGVSPTIDRLSEKNGERNRIIDTNNHFEPEKRPFRSFGVSQNGSYIVFFEGIEQSRWRTIRIFDVTRGAFIADTLTGFAGGVGGVSWLRDESGFFYTRYDEPDPERLIETQIRNSTIYFHRLGTTQGEDRLVFSQPGEPNWLFWPRVTLDGRYLIITEAGNANTRLFFKDLTEAESEVLPLVTEADASYTFVTNQGSTFLISTTRDAPGGKVVAVDSERPATGWSTRVPEKGDATLQAVSEVSGNLVVIYQRHARPLVEVWDLDGNFRYEAELPTIGLIGGFQNDRTIDRTYYRFNSLFDPGSNYELNLKTGESRLFNTPDLPFDPHDFEMRQVFFTSSDGTRVPMFIAGRRGFEQDRQKPVFMYGYGAFKWTAFPWYQPHVLAFMERGGLYAMPGIRGGGEYGEAWYAAGRKLNKPNSIDDYLSAARFLIGEGYTTSELLIANGGSASGVIAAAAIEKEPDLFGAAIIDVPALDMLRFQQFGVGANWASEYGLSDDASEFEVLYSYSPYHNIRPGTCYPPTLVSVGNLDDSTAPFHGYKFVAAMQHAQGCPNPVLLEVMWGAGHAFNLGRTPEQRAETGAVQLTFLDEVLDLKNDAPLASP